MKGLGRFLSAVLVGSLALVSPAAAQNSPAPTNAAPSTPPNTTR
jgi:hypothetical protein